MGSTVGGFVRACGELELAREVAERLTCIWIVELCASRDDDPERAARRALEAGRELLDLPPGVALDGATLAPLVAATTRHTPDALRTELARRAPGVRPELAVHEAFLRASDPAVRKRRGVFTTPEALAAALVRRIDTLLRERFDLPLGLADPRPYVEVVPTAELPDRELPFVQLLDPACGTGAFPLAVAERVRERALAASTDGGDSPGLARERFERELAPALTRRLHLHELLPLPRALARWNLARVLGPSVPPIRSENPLDVWGQLPNPLTVVLGNPPFSVRAGSLSPAARALVEPYRRAAGERVREKGALRLEMHLQDDYVKFLRLAEVAVERAGAGVVALVANHSFLDSPSLRGLRASFVRTFEALELTDLGGSRTRRSEATGPDQNLFGIGQGVATLVGVRGSGARAVTHRALAGSRVEKLERLADPNAVPARRVRPAAPDWLFVPRDERRQRAFEAGVGLDELFQQSVTGIVTAHDHLVVAFDEAALRETLDVLRDGSLGVREVRERVRVRDNAGWKLERALERVRADPDPASALRDVAYRPFDPRRILWHPALVWCDRRRVMGSLGRPDNFALVTCRQLAAPPWRHVLATRELVDDSLLSTRSRERSHCFPLHRLTDARDPASPLVPNLDPRAVEALLPRGESASPEEVAAYVYAVLFDEAYRQEFGEPLSRAFPRLPAARDRDELAARVSLGRELLRVHLDGPTEPVALELEGESTVELARPSFDDGRVRIGETSILAGVDERIWNARIGAHAPARKWLADRRGRRLSESDLASYARLLGTLAETLRLLAGAEEAGLEPRRA